jgi:hypothetical protein
MVKEEDKGRGCVTVHWRDVFFSYRIFIGFSWKCRNYPGKIKKMEYGKKSLGGGFRNSLILNSQAIRLPRINFVINPSILKTKTARSIYNGSLIILLDENSHQDQEYQRN